MQIKLESLVKNYGDVAAVQNISLNIPSITIFGIIGKSGAGKSSLVRLASLLEKPDSGAVYYDDVRVDNLDKKSLIQRRRRIGMIFQNFNLFSSRTAAGNIAYSLEICGTPKAEIKKPATIAVNKPASGGTPLAMAKAMAKGKATIPTITPASASEANVFAE